MGRQLGHWQLTTDNRQLATMSDNQSNPPPQTQKQRWVRYGTNVAVACIVVIVLVALVTYGAQQLTRRLGLRSDTTAGSVHSLKPQSVNIVKNLHQKVRLVGLYPKPSDKMQSANDPESEKYYRFVSDLLDEYAGAGGKVSVEMIDPVAEPTKVDQLLTQVSSQYGKGTKQYRDALGEFPGLLKQIKAFADEQSKRIAALPLKEVKDSDLRQTMQLAAATVQGFPELLQRSQDQVDQELKSKLPDYQGAASQVERNLDTLSRMLGRVAEDFSKLKDQKGVPAAIQQYAAQAAPAFDAIKKQSDAMVAKLKGLGELKQLDTLRENLKSRSILVLGEKDMRIIPFERVWTAPKNIAGMDVEQVSRSLRFAGEQQVSTAIAALEQKKQTKVVFIRPGGAPLTEAGNMFQEGGPLSDIAEQLRQYNFDVLEKDITGQWAMQQQMQRQGMPPTPEPSDDEIKDAIWVVLSFAPKMGRQGPNPLGPKLQEHLKEGGSALVLFFPMADDLSDALKDWGVKARTDLVAMHEPVSAQGTATSDILDNAQRMPIVFVTRQYGDHPLAKPLQSLPSLLSPIIPVQTQAANGITVTPLIPIPQTPASWGESDVNDALQGKAAQFTPAQGAEGGDLANTAQSPLYAGAAVEKKDGGRLVALGALQFAMNQILEIPDQTMLKRGVMVSQFPGNAELFENSIFWLAKMKSMLAISPEALQISRIEPMSDAQLAWWRWGLLIVLLPLGVVVAGAGVYLNRRD
jgi:hypothetical protein